MFGLVKFLFSFALLTAVSGAILYFLPNEIKIDLAQNVSGVVPDELKQKAEDFILDPAEQRDKIISELNSTLTQLKNDPAANDATYLIEQSETLLKELSNKNDDLSIAEIVKTKLVDELFESIATSTPECECEN